MKESRRNSFVLVHGGFHGGWCYSRVADILRNQGHLVYTPTLTGLGERSHLLTREVDCSLHIEDILNVITFEQLDRVVLCGHSYGGTVITGVADKLPDRVTAVVYVDASLPQSGLSTLDLLIEADQALLRSLVVEQGDVPVLMPSPASAFNVNPGDRAMVDKLLTPHPFATLTERLTLTGNYQSVAKKIYVRATGWAGSHPELSYQRVKADPDWAALEIPCGHDIMLDEPARLAEILLNAL